MNITTSSTLQEVFLYLTHDQTIHIKNDNLIKLKVFDEYKQSVFSKTHSKTITNIKHAELSVHDFMDHQIKNNQLRKIEIVYTNGQHISYYLNPDKHQQIQTLTHTDDKVSIVIDEFETNHIADLDLDFHTYNKLYRKGLLTISDLIELTPREFESIVSPIEHSRQSTSPIQIIEYIQTDLYPIEKWLIRNNINYNKTNLFNYESHEHYLIEKASIEELDLGTRAYNGLFRRGIKTIYQLVNSKPIEIQKVRNVGDRTFKEIQKAALLWGEENSIQDIKHFPLFEKPDEEFNQ